MISATVPGMVTVGCSGIRAVSRFSFPSLADLAMRGFAISFLTLANVSSLNSFLAFVFIEPHIAISKPKECSSATICRRN